VGFDADLISSRRSEEDKRYYEYFVSEDAIASHAKLQEAHNRE
jgi:hypothetical protein